uniref:Uncharacterized protein n=1 Tax=Moniliophthora roreri TaxID=221103 RepID=A0A0W0FVU7_MONRR
MSVFRNSLNQKRGTSAVQKPGNAHNSSIRAPARCNRPIKNPKSHYSSFRSYYKACAEELSDRLSSGPFIVLASVNLSIMYLLYVTSVSSGIYVLLFGTLIYMTRNSRRYERLSNFHLWLTTTLFVLATMFVIDFTVASIRESWALFMTVDTGDNREYLRSDVEKRVIISFQRFTFLFINIAADCILIHRCYVIWGSRKLIAAFLIIASLIINTLGLISSITAIIGHDSNVLLSNSEFCVAGNTLVLAYCIGNAVVNVVITFLIAGRIWWIHRQVLVHGIHTSDAYIRPIVRIILEAGLIYPTCLCLHLVVAHVRPLHNFTLYPLVPLSAGIAPTLIMVRAKLGKNIESFQDRLTSIRFTSQPALHLDKEKDTIIITEEQMKRISRKEDISV